jgi:hypothetical protein
MENNMKITALLNDKPIGTIQSLSLIESICDGSDVHQKLYINRIIFDRQRIVELFSRGYLHPATQKVPFQITIEDTDNRIITKIHCVWMETPAGGFCTEEEIKPYVPVSYITDEWVIAEGMQCVAECISSSVINAY